MGQIKNQTQSYYHKKNKADLGKKEKKLQSVSMVLG